MEISKKKVRCHHCGYEWETKSIHKWITCPDCQIKFNTSKIISNSSNEIEEIEKSDEIEEIKEIEENQ